MGSAHDDALWYGQMARERDMTSIVERLRGKPIRGDHVSKLLEVAADEIDRLRIEIERLHALCDNLSRIAISKEAEIERLREQLDIARLALSAPMLGDIPP